MKKEKREELREKRALKMRELRQKKKDDRAAAKAAILKEKAEKKAARRAAAEAKRLKVRISIHVNWILIISKNMMCLI